MSEDISKENFNIQPKMRIKKILIKNKEGEIVGELKNDNVGH